ncbi:MAG TPA: ATP-dependent DNA helicase RecQ [Bryobacteraceae bacterium]|nr:ATP-dependent DNA helicase RecQ [Bryobacteraceae bacterium]
MHEHSLRTLLQKYWGYTDFRPKQEAICSAIVEGHDVAVVMPTGGGKSLCYQLPALALEKTAVVVSPLLSLMQDQVAQLTDRGIPAAALNSSLSFDEQAWVLRAVRNRQLRLLYVSPERLAREDTWNWLQDLDLSFFAIDEAHCISEWGHEFRPEYRQLNRLRSTMPNVPIAAFTASATRQVRRDVLEQLRLNEPRTFISSFFRPNLNYSVHKCKSTEQNAFLLRILEGQRGESLIIYAPTIARVDEVVTFLAANGIRALPYHGKMDADQRRDNQRRWMDDEVRVLVGTVAFGMGINKPDVRAVVHLALPKSIEQYYQEAGRAGRDGEPADCVLLWRGQDAGLLAHFIEQVEDYAERQRSWDRYREVRQFAEAPKCRHAQICLHFGETPKWTSCNACDVCVGLPDWLNGTPSTLKVQLGEKRANAPREAANPELMDRLRTWRRELAKQRAVPAYVILNDRSLEDICAKMPESLVDLEGVFGFGTVKISSLGPDVLKIVDEYGHAER